MTRSSLAIGTAVSILALAIVFFFTGDVEIDRSRGSEELASSDPASAPPDGLDRLKRSGRPGVGAIDPEMLESLSDPLDRQADKRQAPVEATQVQVLVLEEETSRPVEGAQVTITGPFSQGLGKRSTDSSGRAFFDLYPGSYSILAAHPDRLEAQTTLEIETSGSEVPQLQKTIRLPEKILVQGTVRNQHGQAVEDASVVFLPPSRTSGLRPRSVNTRADGSYQAFLEKGTYRVRARRTSHAPLERDFTVTGPSVLDLKLVQEKPLVRFSGRVVDTQGKAVQGASVRISSRGGEAGPLTKGASTDSEGRFLIELEPSEEVNVRIVERGYENLSRRIDLSTDGEETFTLKGFPVFSVIVSDSQGNRLANPRIEGQSANRRKVLIKDSQDGRYYATQYPFKIWAEALGQGLGITSEVMIEKYQPEIHLSMAAGGSLEGYVLDSYGLPVRNFTISLQQARPGSEPAPRHSARINSADGTFAFQNLPPGRFDLYVIAPSLEPYHREVTILEGKTTSLEAALLDSP
ncbi:MAG: carboxypeptidase regulatory-like domain-containing protein [Acidobacteriota bacterium]